MPVRNVQILILVIVVSIACYFQAQKLKYAGRIGSAIQLIEQNYVEDKDPEQLYHAAMKGIVSELDQFSEFVPPSKYKEFQAVIEQKFGGLGVLIEGPPNVKQLTVVAPMPGTPAFKAGMKPGDVIEAIDGTPTDNLGTSEASKLMRGPLGEAVHLVIRRPGVPERQQLTITRADIQVDSVFGDRIQADSSWNFFLEEDPRIAYIRVIVFGERTIGEFKDALAKIKPQAAALIVDLRFNPGGILPSSVSMCDMLVDEGVIVSTKGRRGVFETEAIADAALELDKSIPVVVLVNDQSASASEIMAGCLQDLGRAEIAGSRTYGKGTVQQVFELENDQTALKFTTARFYRPNGKNIHRGEEMSEDEAWGVSPEPHLEMKLTDLQELYLTVRWQRRSDPRISAAEQRPPSPICSADPQLQMVMEHLQRIIEDKP